MNPEFHYPPELLALLTDAISNLVKSKVDVIKFFWGAGVPSGILDPWAERIQRDRGSVYKSQIAREVLCTLNELGDPAIRPRREIVKRIVEWENFETAYPDKQLIARGLVASIRDIVNIKDSFTRMRDKEEQERQASQATYIRQQQEEQKQRDARAKVKQSLYALFGEADSYQRGKALEGVVNGLFKTHGVAVREAFTLRGDAGEGIVEQIDGLIEFRGHLYLVEMKWHKEPIGKPEIAPHLVGVYSRGDARGLFISASGFAPAAISDVKTAVAQKVCVLMHLEETVSLLENEADMKELLRTKIHAAEVDTNPFVRFDCAAGPCS